MFARVFCRLGIKYGIPTENLAQRNRDRYPNPAKENEECPDGHDANMSRSLLASVTRQMPELTRIGVAPELSRLVPRPPTLYRSTAVRSGLHTASICGLGLPPKSLRPSVIMKVAASARPRPIQDVFHSHNLRLQISDFGVVFGAVGPGIRTSEIIIVTAAGTRNATIATVEIFTVSSRYG